MNIASQHTSSFHFDLYTLASDSSTSVGALGLYKGRPCGQNGNMVAPPHPPPMAPWRPATGLGKQSRQLWPLKLFRILCNLLIEALRIRFALQVFALSLPEYNAMRVCFYVKGRFLHSKVESEEIYLNLLIRTIDSLKWFGFDWKLVDIYWEVSSVLGINLHEQFLSPLKIPHIWLCLLI